LESAFDHRPEIREAIMKVEILGTGCQRCDQLYENALTAAASFGPNAGIGIEKIGDVHYFTKMGVFMTPALVIDGEVVAAGKVLPAEDIKKHIQQRR
jgi:small redox-active disulfide protein 2